MPDEMTDGMSANSIDPGASNALGGHIAPLTELARSAGEIVPVAIESSAGTAVTLSPVTVSLTDYDAVIAEFGATDHLGFELRVALSETEASLGALLLPLEGAGALLGLDVSAEQMDDAAFATAQAGPITERVRSFLDLINLTMFTDGLGGTEVTVSELRRGQVDWTMGMVQDVAQGSAPVRIDVRVALATGAEAPVTLILPLSLLTRMGEELAGTSAMESVTAEPPAAAVPTEAAEALFGGASAAPNVTPFPGAAAGRSAGADAFATPPGVGTGESAVHPVRFPPLPAIDAVGSAPQPIDMLMDVSMRVSVELGRSSLTVEEVLELGPGSVVELNKLAGEPVDILVNDRLIARGEVVVVDENFGVRITEIISPRQRANAIGR